MQALRRNTLSSLQNVAAVQRRGYAAASPIYSETVKNLRINADTKVIFQGFTGKQGTYVIPIPFIYFILLTLVLFRYSFHAEQAIAYGIFYPSDLNRIRFE